MSFQKRRKIRIKLSLLMLFWVVMAMGIGSLIWLIRILIIIQQEGIYIANEPNTLILSFEIAFFMAGIFLSMFVLFKISGIMLEKMM